MMKLMNDETGDDHHVDDDNAGNYCYNDTGSANAGNYYLMYDECDDAGDHNTVSVDNDMK